MDKKIQNTKYGFYSAQAAKEHGAKLYSAPGGEVEVTLICETNEPIDYLWDDVVPVGKVYEYVRRIRPVNKAKPGCYTVPTGVKTQTERYK